MAHKKGGFAMIAVILVIMIFFIISVSISTFVVLQARLNYETSMADMSYYLADAGVSIARTRAMYRFFLRQTTTPAGGIYNASDPEFYNSDIAMLQTSEYTAQIGIEIYGLSNLPGIIDTYYTHNNKVACLAALYRADNPSEKIAQRVVFADVYLGDKISNPANITGDGMIRSTLKRYYEKNR